MVGIRHYYETRRERVRYGAIAKSIFLLKSALLLKFLTLFLLETRLQLFDLYFESYQNVFDKNERRNLAQVLTNLIYKRVRFDLEANYFTTSYRLEVSCLYKQAQIVKLILDKMVGEMREMMEKIEDDKKFGVPYSIIKKNPICLTANGSGYDDLWRV